MGNGNAWIFIVVVLVVAAAITAVVTYFLTRSLAEKFRKEQQERADNIVTVANERAKAIELEGRDKALKVLEEAETDIGRRRSELGREEERLQKRRAELDHRVERLELREQTLNKRQSALDKRTNEVEKMASQHLAELQRIAQLSVEEARALLLAEAETEARNDMARIIRQVETEARTEGEKRARSIISDAIQRVASDHVAAVSTSVVTLPNEEMKGRIVGRNGRNIRAFEQAAGVDVIVDDTPEAVTISCFDPIRREIARRTLDRLIVDGRIHPAHIEKILAEEQRDVEKDIIQAGEQAVYEAGVGALHPEISRMLGRLKYRTSYGQNQLAHAVEVAKLAALIAADLGADVEVARQAGLLHDLGKAMDHNTEGTHAQLGAEFARRYGVNPRVVNAIAAHHHEVEQESVEAVIAEAADAISGARPGARREDLEQYIKRLRALEDIASSFKGVQQSYAIQAGREVRIIVRPDDVDDLAALRMARDIAKKIEETMQYPGQIKVTVIREMRAVEFAK
ncbi:MAG TPA: ribonuclease Y [Anaerolineaceae bacterium]|nr:ribonuclease Y [Longilinea sp.]HNZ00214.1 ribonuclease Y [Anaerolineaceae bacterium]HOD43979.1 ribonuclease Y [Anaerolineaceae bacterium]HOH18938.1 ribonuclease Y [Anaerolineaceae bacterium]HOU43298.1 ribonuclease Y [Anaerolineaceae bacterium]